MSANTGSLGDLQRAFQDYLLASSESLQAAVRDTKKANRLTLLDVYRDGYALRLIEALTTDYPGVMAMAGPADFDHMARAYIALLRRGVSSTLYNVSSGTTRVMRSVLDALVARARVQVRVETDPALMRPSDTPIVLGDPTRLREATGWRPEVSFDQTLDDLLTYWRSITTA